jgi:hypothetical protein
MMRRIGSESCFAHPHEMFLPTVTLEPLCLHNIECRAFDETVFAPSPVGIGKRAGSRLECSRDW